MPLPSTRSRAVPRDAVHHPLFARYYARISVGAESRMGMAGVRERLLAGLSGRVIEVGAGNGLNFSHYPDTVAEVVAVEPEPMLRRLAVEAALRSRVPVDVAPGAAEALPVKAEAFDAAVLSLVLCSVRDVPRALGELRRVLRPGGQVRFFEHGRGGGRVMTFTQRALDRTLWPALAGGCHLSREPVAALRDAGFALGPYRRVMMPETGPALPSSY
ncbi:class I SAM-dependent methyltransferase [Streptomyces lienomycini]|uniref:Class I SAM-dependent methyltransferase n=2 Tax=Streptomyces TaxID=1883 RepID=A0ABV9X5V6_9ACTN|nr:class I SAM-dependent methyltransferase [Streptomyces lienomycini]